MHDGVFQAGKHRPNHAWEDVMNDHSPPGPCRLRRSALGIRPDRSPPKRLREPRAMVRRKAYPPPACADPSLGLFEAIGTSNRGDVTTCFLARRSRGRVPRVPWNGHPRPHRPALCGAVPLTLLAARRRPLASLQGAPPIPCSTSSALDAADRALLVDALENAPARSRLSHASPGGDFPLVASPAMRPSIGGACGILSSRCRYPDCGRCPAACRGSSAIALERERITAAFLATPKVRRQPVEGIDGTSYRLPLRSDQPELVREFAPSGARMWNYALTILP